MAHAPHANKWFVLATTSLAAFLGAVMFTSVNVAIPSLEVAFATSFNAVQWVVLAYLLATGALLPIVGRLADMFGKRRFYLLGLFTFTLGSLLCGLSPTVATLIAARAVQGLGAAAITALGLALVTDVFPATERGRAIGVSGSVLSVGIVVGPTLGGFLVDVWSWQWIFLLAVPLGILCLLLAWRFLPPSQPGDPQRFDLAGAVVLFAALLTLSLALTLGQGLGFTHPSILGLFVMSGLLLLVFLAIEQRAEAPVIELSLFRNRQLTLSLVTGFATFISIAGTIFLMPFYLENILGYAPRNVGLLMSIVPVVLVVVAPIAGALADRFGERPVAVVGLAMLLLGYLLLLGLDEQTTALEYVLRFLPVGLGMAIFQTPNNSAIMGSVDRSRTGIAAGLLALTRTLGQTAGIAVLGTVWAARVGARAAAAGVALDGSATTAPAAAQIGALHDMFVVIQLIIALALLLTVRDLLVRRRELVMAPSD